MSNDDAIIKAYERRAITAERQLRIIKANWEQVRKALNEIAWSDCGAPENVRDMAIKALRIEGFCSPQRTESEELREQQDAVLDVRYRE